MSEAISTSSSGSASLQPACALCGLPLGRSQIHLDFDGKALRFCCLGCRGVYQILSNSPEGTTVNFQETALYRACQESGIIPRSNADLEKAKAAPELPSAESPAAALLLTLRIEGMWCPACSWLIEEVLHKTGGVPEAKVLFFSDLANIKYHPHRITPQEILGRISGLGYRASLFQEEQEQAKEKRLLLLRLGISSILTFNIMMLAFALYYGFFEDLTVPGIRFLSWPLWAMATPVVFYGGWPVLRKGLSALRYRTATMETLISVGALSAYGYSFFQMLRGSLHLYFDTAAMIVTLVLIGKYIELHARQKVSKGIVELYEFSNQKVRLAHSSFSSSPVHTLPRDESKTSGSEERWILAKEVKVGDEFAVLAGERIPLDARIVSGKGNLDESFLTGESRPVRRGPGDEVLGGSLVLDGDLTLKTTREAKEGTLGQMITLMQEALLKKNPAEVLADRITRWFVPAIFFVAVGTGSYLWIGRSPVDEALLRALTVLVISCPCALGIATPLAKVAAMDVGRRRGILVRDPAALEQVKDLDTVIFDKTGTVTEGNFDLQNIYAEEGEEEEILKILGTVEIGSSHFLARAVVRKAREAGAKLETASRFEEFEGLGVKGIVAGKTVLIGSPRFLREEGLTVSSSLEEKAASPGESGKTLVFFGWDGRARGFAVFGDRLRPGIREMTQALHSQGIETWLISGDSEDTTGAIAREAGIRNVRGQSPPQEKARLLRDLQAQKRLVGMVGDGINDAAALAQADVGFSLGTDANLAREASALTFLTPDPARILDARNLSLLTCKIIRQNLFFAFFYNALAIPLAASGFLNPLIAVFAMFASSLTVIANASRLSRMESLMQERSQIRINGVTDKIRSLI
ncbi:MAG: copper-translocating P-type ATPase [Deltaproteobacteria bacterium]|nr:copper-translocating P-type ATPase [Deltaproteobacteria bacterium]